VQSPVVQTGRRPAQAPSECAILAREFDDGLLQTLTGAALQLESAVRLVETDAPGARDQIREVQELIVERQRELRSWIDAVRRAAKCAVEISLPLLDEASTSICDSRRACEGRFSPRSGRADPLPSVQQSRLKPCFDTP
jgi:hypothetical protein